MDVKMQSYKKKPEKKFQLKQCAHLCLFHTKVNDV